MISRIQVKLEHDDNHKIIQLFKDVTEQLLIINDGYEGIIRSYEFIELLSSVKKGDFIEVIGELVAFDYTNRRIKVEARKVVTPSEENIPGEYLIKPTIVSKAIVVCEVPIDKQNR